MANREGKQQAITTISPMESSDTCKLNFFFFIRKLGLAMGEAIKLKRLSFIHFARWAIIKRDAFPYLGAPQPRETLKYDYLIFCSNFNGSWDQYIDAFSDVLSKGMDNIWGGSEQYPGAVPSTPFKQYIRHNQIGTDYYYSAYPGATTSDVQSALHLHEEFTKFVDDHGGDPADLFEQEFQQLLLRVQSELGSTGKT
jgi:hypothetical protein